MLVGNKTYRSIVADYRASFTQLAALPTDVMLPGHEEQGHLLDKRRKMLAGDTKAFIDPTELPNSIEASRKAFETELARQQKAAQ